LKWLEPLKAHVLGEVGQAALVFVFEDGAGLDHQAQFELARRVLVLADVIGQAIRQLADLDLGTGRNGGLGVEGGARDAWRQQRGGDGGGENGTGEKTAHPVDPCRVGH
jgi:hypothetical protein